MRGEVKSLSTMLRIATQAGVQSVVRFSAGESRKAFVLPAAAHGIEGLSHPLWDWGTNSKQKETKLAKICWRAELCDASCVRDGTVAGSQELAPPFASWIFVSFAIFCFRSFFHSRSFASFVGSTSVARTLSRLRVIRGFH